MGAGFNLLQRLVRNDAIKIDVSDIYNRRVFLLACASYFGGMLFGIDTGIISRVITLPASRQAFGYVKCGKQVSDLAIANLSANIVSVVQALAFAGAILATPVVQKWGRKPALLIAAIFAALGGVLQAVASGEIACLSVGRFVMLLCSRILTSLRTFLVQ
ncbi:Hypothetical protein R9X50_00438400 [Acrodontium crateriforme]|uniref:Major facilitator superfamily (MFS) profile domain-containing protein n=1 Tax=Acrodontium crateriforme TaxID=150365 RepID=A0AAQ3M7K3_9PEZI|nr:Hypothetical protein R9X50_00438400 [Acrodontium crateriforme]